MFTELHAVTIRDGLAFPNYYLGWEDGPRSTRLRPSTPRPCWSSCLVGGRAPDRRAAVPYPPERRAGSWTGERDEDRPDGLLLAVDSVQIPVPDLDAALAFYRDRLGHELLWRTPTAAAVRLSRDRAELVLQLERPEAEVDFLVASVDQAVTDVVAAGGTVVEPPFDIPVGRVARVADPFGTVLTLLDLSKGRYQTDADGQVTGVRRASTRPGPGPAAER